jgi:hypothetical protein
MANPNRIGSGRSCSNVSRLDHGSLRCRQTAFWDDEFKHAVCYLSEIHLRVLKAAALVLSQTIDVGIYSIHEAIGVLVCCGPKIDGFYARCLPRRKVELVNDPKQRRQ